MPTNPGPLFGPPLATLTGRTGAVTVSRGAGDFFVTASDLTNPDRHIVLEASARDLADFAAGILTHLDNRPTERASVPYDEPFPVSVRLNGGHNVLNVLDDGDDLAVLVPGVKLGATRVSPAQVGAFARTLAEVMA